MLHKLYHRNSSGFRIWQELYCVTCYTKSWPCSSSSENGFYTVSPLKAVGILAGLGLKIDMSKSIQDLSFKRNKKKK